METMDVKIPVSIRFFCRHINYHISIVINVSQNNSDCPIFVDCQWCKSKQLNDSSIKSAEYYETLSYYSVADLCTISALCTGSEERHYYYEILTPHMNPNLRGGYTANG